MAEARLDINLDEDFERLPHAPIVEAVIHWRARAERTLDPEQFLGALKERLDDYPHHQPQHEIQLETHFGPQGSLAKQEAHWQGFRFESTDKLHIAQ